MVNLDEIAKVLGSSIPISSETKNIEEKKAAKKDREPTKKAAEAKITEDNSEENIEEKIVEEKSEIEEKAGEQTKEENRKEQKEIDEDYIDPLSEDYKKSRNNLMGRKVL